MGKTTKAKAWVALVTAILALGSAVVAHMAFDSSEFAQLVTAALVALSGVYGVYRVENRPIGSGQGDR